ncbi:OLC1v1008033C1 [Oldenlandia corymbosa var. corymbosa]|nr:OLC1v1008033C1 [Oldenlandia corymbosa var. corymbosa]
MDPNGKVNHELESSAEVLLNTDILREVLLRADAKTICTCGCVCKIWNETIADPFFVNKHRDQSSKAECLLFLVSVHEDYGYCHKYTTVDYKKLDMEAIVVAVFGVANVYNDHDYIAFGGDLVCIVKDSVSFDETIVLWLCNPQTGQTRALPEPFDYTDDYCVRTNEGCVFGYVSSKREYVVLMMGLFCYDDDADYYRYYRDYYEDDESDLLMRAKKFVFSLDKDNIDFAYWEEIQGNSPCHVGEDGILVGNSAYWVAVERDGRQIVTLDREEDKFGLVAKPADWNPASTPCLVGLKVLWSLIKSSGDSDWEKEYEISLDFPVRVVPGSSSGGELIIKSQPDIAGKFVEYYVLNPETESVRFVYSGEIRMYSAKVGFYWRSFFAI